MASRIFLCFTAASCCITLLSPPVHGRRPAGLAAAGGGGLVVGHSRHLLHQLPVPVPVPDQPRFVPTGVDNEERRRRVVPATTKARRPAAVWSVLRPELRTVPGGPDPLHHHGGSPSKRPEQQDHRTPSP